MDIADKIYEEWAWRSETGTPSMDNPQDLKLLQEIYREHGILQEESTQYASKISEKNLDTLTKVIKNIKSDFSKYISVFNYFSPKSNIELSEVLFAKLLEKEGKGKIQLGNPNKVSSLTVNGEQVTLKSLEQGEKIELGGDIIRTTPEEVKKLIEGLLPLFTERPELSEYTVGKLVHELPSSKFTLIDNYFKNLARRLTGKEGRDAFVWIEKIVKDDQLKEVQIHVIKYSYEEVVRAFLTSSLHVNSSGWYLKKNGEHIAVTDKDKTQVFLHPSLLEEITESSPITIPVNEVEEAPAAVKEKISDRLLKSLDKIYDDIFDSFL